MDEPLCVALADRGARVHQVSWRDDDVDWAGLDLAIVRTTWDYADDRDGFLAWARSVAEVTRLHSTPEILEWNTHKGYLAQLEDRGAPVVPTAWLAAGDHVDLVALLASRGWREVLVKPAVGAGARRVVRARHDDAAALRAAAGLLATDDVLVQPYLPAVETTGELSVVVVDGAATHAVRKRPRVGDFRVQREHGGREDRAALDRETRALAEWIVESTGHDLLVARVDLLADDTGSWQLVELEATEPDLYLRLAPEVAGVLAEAIVARAG